MREQAGPPVIVLVFVLRNACLWRALTMGFAKALLTMIRNVHRSTLALIRSGLKRPDPNIERPVDGVRTSVVV